MYKKRCPTILSIVVFGLLLWAAPASSGSSAKCIRQCKEMGQACSRACKKGLEQSGNMNANALRKCKESCENIKVKCIKRCAKKK